MNILLGCYMHKYIFYIYTYYTYYYIFICHQHPVKELHSQIGIHFLYDRAFSRFTTVISLYHPSISSTTQTQLYGYGGIPSHGFSHLSSIWIFNTMDSSTRSPFASSCHQDGSGSGSSSKRCSNLAGAK